MQYNIYSCICVIKLSVFSFNYIVQTKLFSYNVKIANCYR